jgi:lipoate-protein ligase A
MQVYFLRTKNFPILKQLEIEEGFLRTQSSCLVWINEGSPPAAILGISSKVSELIDEKVVNALSLPLIRRYSGGGTVVVDHNTLFVTFIFNLHDFSLPGFPGHIMNWSKQFYAPFLKDKGFALRENDYTLNGKKFGGNAQYLTKNRFVHHTTLLYAYNPELMKALLMPSKAPLYREKRNHEDFLVTLNTLFSSQESFTQELTHVLKEHFILEETTPLELEEKLKLPYRMSTQLLDLAVSII